MATVAERRARPASQAWYRSKQGRETVKQVIAFIVLVAIGLLFVAPFLWMLSTSLKPALYVFTQGWIPHPFVWQNYYDALTSAPFDVYFRNTILITTLSVVGAVLSSSLVAYSFARLKWPGRDVLFGIVLATMILPSIVTLIPQYILFAKIGWVNTFLPLIVPVWLGGSAFYIFLLRQFYRGIPMELSEAARIDGASELRIWWQIVQPLARPALAAVAIFSFNGAWEDYFNPLIYLSSESKYTLQLGLTTFEGGGGGAPQWNLMMAASLVVMIPVLAIFIFGQRYFIEGVSLSGMGGR